MTTPDEDLDAPSLEVGDLWERFNDLGHDINDMRRDVYELEQQIAELREERRTLRDAIEEHVGTIDWGPHE